MITQHQYDTAQCSVPHCLRVVRLVRNGHPSSLVWSVHSSGGDSMGHARVRPPSPQPTPPANLRDEEMMPPRVVLQDITPHDVTLGAVYP